MWARIRSGGDCKVLGCDLLGVGSLSNPAGAPGVISSSGVEPLARAITRRSEENGSPRLEAQADHLVDQARRSIPCEFVAVMAIENGTLRTLAADGLDDVGLSMLPSGHPLLRLAPDAPVTCPWPEVSSRGRRSRSGEPSGSCMCCLVSMLGQPVAALTVGSEDEAALSLRACVDFLGLCTPHPEQNDPFALRSAEGACQIGTTLAPPEDGVHRRCPTTRLIGESALVARLRTLASSLARSSAPILIQGETGVGKEAFATRVHRESARRDRELAIVHCTASPPALIERELFGLAGSAFGDDRGDRAGAFERAQGGTVYFDEVGELSLELQAKLARAIRSGEIQRAGGENKVRVDVRFIAATSGEPEEEVAEGRIRADLCEALKGHRVHVPALREHSEDIGDLVRQFSACAGCELDAKRVAVTAPALEALKGHRWPGNVDELRRVVRRAALRASGGMPAKEVKIEVAHLSVSPDEWTATAPSSIPPSHGAEAISLETAINHFQQAMIASVLRAEGGCWRGAAQRLQLSRSSLSRLAHRLRAE